MGYESNEFNVQSPTVTAASARAEPYIAATCGP
jgi:hypothetical protein